MINCEMIQRYTGALMQMPFAANYIALRELDTPRTHWLRLDQIKWISEAFVLKHRCRWRRFPFIPVRAEHTDLVVVVNDEYAIYGIDVIKFLLECRLAREDNDDFKVQ